MENQGIEKSNDNLLQFLLNHYNLTIEDVLKQKNDMKRNELINQHVNNYSGIWQGKNNRWYTYLPNENGKRKLIAKSTQVKLENSIVDYYSERESEIAIESLTLRELYPLWFKEKWLETNNSNTMKHIDLEWRKHYLHDAIIDLPVISFTKQQLKTWARQLILEKNMTKKQYYNMQIIMRQSLDYLVELNKIDENLFRGFVINKNLFTPEPEKEIEREVFNITEEKEIKRTALADFQENPSRTSSLAVVLNFSLGLRVGELVALKWKDLKESYLHIRRMEQKQYTLQDNDTWKQHIEVVEHTKSEKGFRTLYVVNSALDIFQLIKESNIKNGYDCSPESYIFVHNHERISANSIDWYYEKYCNKLGIVKKGNHKARKTCLTKIADNPNINLKDAMDFAGHADVKTFVKHYCFSRYSDDYKRSELEKTLG